jgi:hypothetical protein
MYNIDLLGQGTLYQGRSDAANKEATHEKLVLYNDF